MSSIKEIDFEPTITKEVIQASTVSGVLKIDGEYTSTYNIRRNSIHATG
jgi:hypothetical protein